MRRSLSLSPRAQLDLMLAPYVIGLTLLVLAPLLITLALAFTQYDLFSLPRWHWIDNFRHFFVDRLFQRALYNSLWFALIAVPVRVTAALLLALLLNRPGRAYAATRAALYLPAIVPDVAYALAWLLVLNPGFGPLNLGLRAVGLPGWPCLQTPVTARASLIVMWIFQLGEGFILLLAARQTLSADLFESAALDGASRWQAFRRVTLPPGLRLFKALSLHGNPNYIQLVGYAPLAFGDAARFVIEALPAASYALGRGDSEGATEAESTFTGPAWTGGIRVASVMDCDPITEWVIIVTKR
jgi:ABC-type sugar transport system permease subunit